jgi:hypothetical protein
MADVADLNTDETPTEHPAGELTVPAPWGRIRRTVALAGLVITLGGVAAATTPTTVTMAPPALG